MSAITLDAEGTEVAPREVPPRRVGLPRSAIERLADLVGVESPAGQMASEIAIDSIGARLGGLGESASAQSAESAEVADGDVDELLVSAGLVAEGQPTAEGAAVLEVWHGATVAIELEMLLSLRLGGCRVRSWHRNLADWVVCLSTADGETYELSWHSADDWWLELGRAIWVGPDTLASTPPSEPLPDVIETPWELLLATGEAVHGDRAELLDQMVGDYSGQTLAGGRSGALEPAADVDVRRWHEQLETASCGRLHAAVMGRSERGRPGAGIVEWVLFADGWRSLTPFRRDGWNFVRIERRGPTDLGRALAVLAAEVTS